MVNFLKNSLLIVFFSTGLWLFFRRRNRKRLVILMYHGVSDYSLPFWTQVSEGMFELQMKYISKFYKPISLHEAVLALKDGRILPDYSVAVTFDDGFRNNLKTAFPILKKYNIPVTIFLTTSFVEGDGVYEGLLWPEYVIFLFHATGKNMRHLGPELSRRFNISTSSNIMKIGEKVISSLKKMPSEQIADAVIELKKLLEVDESEIDYRALAGLNWEEVIQLNNEELVTFGAHTVNHEILSKLTVDQISDEVINSKKIIEHKIGQPVSLFAYPNGCRGDFDDSAKRIVADNFDASVSAIKGFCSEGDDLYELKRIPIGNNTNMTCFKMFLAGAFFPDFYQD